MPKGFETLPQHLRRDYHLLRPVESHHRRASCKSVGCQAYENGWRTRFPAGEESFHAAVRSSGRKFSRLPDEEGHAVYVFEPGQQCLRPHFVPNEDAQTIHVIRDSTRAPLRTSAQGWHDDLGEHLDRFRETVKRG